MNFRFSGEPIIIINFLSFLIFTIVEIINYYYDTSLSLFLYFWPYIFLLSQQKWLDPDNALNFFVCFFLGLVVVYFWGLVLKIIFRHKIFGRNLLSGFGIILSLGIWWYFLDYLMISEFWPGPVWLFSGILLIMILHFIQKRKTNAAYKEISPQFFLFSVISWNIPLTAISALGMGAGLVFKWPIGE